jgi:hypothetical protein
VRRCSAAPGRRAPPTRRAPPPPLASPARKHLSADNDGFGGGNLFRGNVVFNAVRETGDHV